MVNAVMSAVVVVARTREGVMRQSGRMAIRRAAMMTAAMAATDVSASTVSAATATDVAAATTATVAATAVRVGQAHRNCQTAPDGHCAQKLPHDAAPYAFQM
jgi:hypothetical protein